MLSLHDVSLISPNGNYILSGVSTIFPKSHICAIVGPSGCGKTSLIKTIAGIGPGFEKGLIYWNQQNLNEKDFSPTDLGYVPQFNITYPQLTARESVFFSLKLKLSASPSASLTTIVEQTLEKVGLLEVADVRVSSLSGGQLRRLSLAIELCQHPQLLLCDEVTSGLDPRSEIEILNLLRSIAHSTGCLILAVTHGIEHLAFFDSIVVLFGGHLAYHGPPQYLNHYFRIQKETELFDQLLNRSPEDWDKSWKKHHSSFLQQILPSQDSATLSTSSLTLSLKDTKPSLPQSRHLPATEDTPEIESLSPQPPPLPTEPSPCLPFAILRQTLTLLHRRLLLLVRDPSQVILHFGLILGFPAIVALFAWNGFPAVKNLSLGLDISPIRQFSESLEFLAQSSHIGTLVSGVVMLQVILLTLLGANNSGREISAHRQIIEKEKLSGLNPTALLLSHFFYLSIFSLAQSFWMGFFVRQISGMPGSFTSQLLFLVLSNAAMTSASLAISSWLDNPEKSTLASIYLVGFQLPLSGAILAIPEPIGSLIRPFIAAYWGWSGYLQTLRDERYYDIVVSIAQTTLSSSPLCLIILLSHIFLGYLFAWIGLRRFANVL